MAKASLLDTACCSVPDCFMVNFLICLLEFTTFCNLQCFCDWFSVKVAASTSAEKMRKDKCRVVCASKIQQSMFDSMSVQLCVSRVHRLNNHSTLALVCDGLALVCAR